MDADRINAWCAAIALISLYVIVVSGIVYLTFTMGPLFAVLLIPALAGLVALAVKAKQELC